MMHQRIETPKTVPLPDLTERALWAILTVSGGNTLALARSLRAAGHTVWTPVAWNERRRRRTDERFEVEAAVTPTYVFARVGRDELEAADGVAELARIAAAYLSPHPAFAVFQYRGRLPLVAASSLGLLCAEHVKEQTESELRIAKEVLRIQEIAEAKQRAIALELLRQQVEAARLRHEEARAAAREALRQVRASAPRLARGDQVTSDQAVLKGLVGVVQGQRGHETLVLFGGSVPFKIETWLLQPAGVKARATA